MDTPAQKAARSAYKERKVSAGVWRLRCKVTGQCWVATSPDLSTAKNRQWFTLGMGTHPNRALQAAWNEHGKAAFSFEIIERLDDAVTDLACKRVLSERHAYWMGELSAQAI